MVVVEEVVVAKMVPGVETAGRPRRKSWCPNNRCPEVAPPVVPMAAAVVAVVLPIGLVELAIRPKDLVLLSAMGLVEPGSILGLARDPLLLLCSIGSLRQSRATNVGRDYFDRSQWVDGDLR